MERAVATDESRRQEARFRAVFRAAHAGHAACAGDEWLAEPCRTAGGGVADRPIIWSRRNGPWRRVEILWVGAAPGNAGGKGASALGAHGTRIPFGGDVAGANLEVLLGAIGITRHETFITAALNQLPARGGGEPTAAEIRAPVGRYPSSLHLLRDTLVAAGPTLVVALGNVALRAAMAAALAPAGRSPPSLPRLARAGMARNVRAAWPAELWPDDAFLDAWSDAWGQDPLPAILWLTHPSAQNMSPFAGRATAFHGRMIEARDALRRAVREVLSRDPPAERPATPDNGIYALPEWRQHVRPRLERLDGLWREKGV